jgi:two-component system, OmpR family, sensor kinase
VTAWRRGLPGRVRRRLARLPLRARLVTGFVVAIGLVLVLAGGFVYWRVAYALDLRLDGDLRAKAATLGPLVTPAGPLRPDAGLDRSTALRQYQVLDGQGQVLAAGSDLGEEPVLSGRRLRSALAGPVVVDVGALLPVSPRPLRLLAVPVPGPGPARVLVVAERRDRRDEALRELVGQLVLAGLGALVVSAVVGERLAKAALVPVERYRTQAAAIADGESGVRLDVPTGRDDEVTRLGHTLNRVLDALEQAVDRERRFTQDASHELRTPLTLLSTRVQLALRRERTPDEQVETLRELGTDIARLSALADQLLGVSTATVAGPAGDLLSVVRDAVPAEELVLDGPPSPVVVCLPDAQLRQVLDNLLANARVHGGAPVQIRLRVAGETAVLTVTDSGRGVPGDFLPLAADRFARDAGARSRPGAGLGLSLVRALVDGCGGELRLCANGQHHAYADRHDVPCAHPTAGTTATVLLPMG